MSFVDDPTVMRSDDGNVNVSAVTITHKGTAVSVLDTLKKMELRQVYQNPSYRRGGDKVMLEKIGSSDMIKIEDNEDGKTVVVWSEGQNLAVKANVVLLRGKWYYEVKILTSGSMQFGFVSSCYSTADRRRTIGDCRSSWAYDGKRQMRYHRNKWELFGMSESRQRSDSPSGRKWKPKDVLGVAIDMDNQTINYYLNGVDLGTAFEGFDFDDDVQVNASSAYIAISESPFHSSRYAGQIGEDEDEDDDPDGEPTDDGELNDDGDGHLNNNFNSINAATFFGDLEEEEEDVDGETGDDDDVDEIAVAPEDVDQEGDDLDEDDVLALATLHQHHEHRHHQNMHHHARGAVDSDGDEEDDGVVGMIPAASFGEDEGCVFNFGSNYFEYDIPHGYLALDVANVSLGNLLPFNQHRGFIDISHCLTNSLPLPPYFYDSTDYYKGTTSREGPQYVDFVSMDGNGILTNETDVKNVGMNFNTIVANVRVWGGKWYYEVTLSTHGLMQIGWVTNCFTPVPQSGVGVGDDLTGHSWSIDLFRKLKWRKGVGTPFGHRKWAAGDVVGCAVDIGRRIMKFSLNGEWLADERDATVGEDPATMVAFSAFDIEQGISPAASFRASNGCSFNFGGYPLRYKPEGYQTLGIADTWLEKIDDYYSLEQFNTYMLASKDATSNPSMGPCYPFGPDAGSTFNLSGMHVSGNTSGINTSAATAGPSPPLGPISPTGPRMPEVSLIIPILPSSP